ncbi:MAG: FAD-dependent oxidoreductase [Rhodospirillaceae bacterium]|nr:FAD-dependent oxidoreductase [Rhodospirillaceae bacterium]MBT3495132.1 FAD-dependent oxidoreductase [Rhodospirillaceae bacterium]MBT3782558.1 FAD-dependent oxidoreductase [Rhodospirillaceae bacterium]MBT3977178.1 FAD-dependent oxidoreductase [Rhodospirillaceae bacterium]MBT4168324.1 FAD-dependent oxidoreductase [Rhodospirillaceae bacterium]
MGQATSIDIPGGAIPVAYEADVVVVGAGPGGFAAALQAARMGADVILVEKFDMPGGVHTSGLQGAANEGVGGIHSELMARFASEGHIYIANEKTHPNWAGNPLSHYERGKAVGSAFTRMTFNPEGAGCVMVDMLYEAGVNALYGTAFIDCIVEPGTGNNSIRAVVVENADGRFAIGGRIFIEGSGTGQLAARAGAPFVPGGGPQPEGAHWDGIKRPIPGGLLWTMSGVNFQNLVRHQEQANDPLLEKVIAEARAADDLPDGLYRPRMDGKAVYGDSYIGHPTVDMSPMAAAGTYVLWQNAPYDMALRMDSDGRDQATATRLLRGFVNAEAKFLKKYVPGFEDASIASVGRFVGVRDGRHPVGEHVFCLDDVRAGRQFRDAVTKPMTKTFFWDGYRPYTFEVSFKSFLPKLIDNLILTGASLSFTYETIFMVMRNFPWCTQTGEIAGFAAARCIAKKIRPKDLDWREPYF